MTFNESLRSNLLPINVVEPHHQFSFSTKKDYGPYALGQSDFSPEMREAFAGSMLPQHLYTHFGPDEGGELTLPISLHQNSRLRRHYIHHLLTEAFIRQGLVLANGFVREINLFLPSRQADSSFRVFESFRLKLEHNDWSDGPLLQISYHGISKVLRESMLELEDDHQKHVSRVLYRGKIYSYIHMPDAARYNLQEVYPLLSNKLGMLLQPNAPARRTTNVYHQQHQKITDFALEHLTLPAVRRVLHIDTHAWVQPPEKNLFQVSRISNQLLLGEPPHVSVYSPKVSLGMHGPFSLPKHKEVKFFAIFGEKDRDTANELFKALNNFEGKGVNGWIPGKEKSLYDYVRLRFTPEHDLSLRFQSTETLLAELQRHLDQVPLNHHKSRYVAFYLSPVSETSESVKDKMLYYALKEMLLKYQVSVQVIDRAKIRKPAFRRYYIHNIAPAVLAKAGGIPWQLQNTHKEELIVGVGAFRSQASGVQYIGSAFSFNCNGSMRQFNCITKNELFVLAGDIKEYILQHLKEFGRPQRLIIHYYKTMSDKNLKPITDMLYRLNLGDLPVFILSMSKTLSEDYILFDHSFQGLLPKSGTIAQIRKNEYLLFNNTRYENSNNNIESYYYPLRLRVSCSQPVLLDNKATVKTLIDQVYQFSRVYWKSVKQQNLPVTVSYPAMLAEIYSHFKDPHLNEFARTNLWFL